MERVQKQGPLNPNHHHGELFPTPGKGERHFALEHHDPLKTSCCYTHILLTMKLGKPNKGYDVPITPTIDANLHATPSRRKMLLVSTTKNHLA
jgi:hypothetical protein